MPWERPCKFELDVALEGLTAVAGSEAPALSLVFLVDGSGSVTEGADSPRIAASKLASLCEHRNENAVILSAMPGELCIAWHRKTIQCPSLSKGVAGCPDVTS